MLGQLPAADLDCQLDTPLIILKILYIFSYFNKISHFLAPYRKKYPTPTRRQRHTFHLHKAPHSSLVWGGFSIFSFEDLLPFPFQRFRTAFTNAFCCCCSCCPLLLVLIFERKSTSRGNVNQSHTNDACGHEPALPALAQT